MTTHDPVRREGIVNALSEAAEIQAAILDVLQTAGIAVAGDGGGGGPAATKTLQTAPINFAASGDNVVVGGTVGQTVRIHRMWFTAAQATTLTFKQGSTALSGALSFAVNGSMVLDYSSEPHFVTAAGAAFVIASSAAAQVSGMVEYVKSA